MHYDLHRVCFPKSKRTHLKMSMESTYTESLLSDYRSTEDENANVHVITEQQYQQVQAHIQSLKADNVYFRNKIIDLDRETNQLKNENLELKAKTREMDVFKEWIVLSSEDGRHSENSGRSKIFPTQQNHRT